MSETVNDISKLPRWAQIRIQKLEADLDYAKAELSIAFGQMPTCIEVDPYRRDIRDGNADYPTYLRENAIVRYTVTGGTIDIRLRDGEVEIVGEPSGLGNFAIMPRAGNVVVARLHPRSR